MEDEQRGSDDIVGAIMDKLDDKLQSLVDAEARSMTDLYQRLQSLEKKIDAKLENINENVDSKLRILGETAEKKFTDILKGMCNK